MSNDNELGWVKIHRKMLDWEWYEDTNTVRLFLHIILKANFEEKKWRGSVIHRGQLVTSVSGLSFETNLTIKQVRTCLDRLISCGAVGKQTTNKYTLLTICNYESYQQNELANGKQEGKQEGNPTANKGQTKGKQRATTKEYKESKELKEIKNNNMLTHIVSAHTQQFYDWLKENCPYLYDNLRLPTDEQFERLCSTYGSQLIADICLQIENRADLRKKYKVLYPTLCNWLKKEKQSNMTNDEREREKRLASYAKVAADFFNNGEVRNESAVLAVVPF